MTETILGLIGLYMMYTWGHFTYLSFKVVYKERNVYEKVVTWIALVTMFLYIIGTL